MRRLLLDTHVLLWAVDKPARLPPEVAELISDTGNDVLFSAASIWEIAVKAALRRPDFLADPAVVAAAAVTLGFIELPITAAVAARVANLRRLHNDPFDRLLIVQAMSEPAHFLTVDTALERYSELVRRFRPL